MAPETSSNRLSTPLSLTKSLIWLVVIGYGLFLVVTSTAQNYRMNREINTQKDHIKTLEQRNILLKLALVYYRSNSYKEIEARRLLGVKGKDEHVVALPQANTAATLGVADASAQPQSSAGLPPYLAWWRLFFGPR